MIYLSSLSKVLPIENQMRRPKDMLGWNGVLSTSMTMVRVRTRKRAQVNLSSLKLCFPKFLSSFQSKYFGNKYLV